MKVITHEGERWVILDDDIRDAGFRSLPSFYWWMSKTGFHSTRIDNPNLEEERQYGGSYSPTIRIISESDLEKMKTAKADIEAGRAQAKRQNMEKIMAARQARKEKREAAERHRQLGRDLRRAERNTRMEVRIVLANFDRDNPSVEGVDKAIVDWKASLKSLIDYQTGNA